MTDPEKLLDRLRGCLLGGAIGDALGAPVEFLSLQEITARFGPPREVLRLFADLLPLAARFPELDRRVRLVEAIAFLDAHHDELRRARITHPIVDRSIESVDRFEEWAIQTFEGLANGVHPAEVRLDA